MTPAEEARFIQLWSEGASYAALAEAFGCPLGTVGSRAYALVRQGKIAGERLILGEGQGAESPYRTHHGKGQI